jgi:hypothetical protein
MTQCLLLASTVLPNNSYNHFARPTESTVFYCLEGASIGPLPSNGCPIVERLCSGNVFAEPLPGSGHMRHSI